jgi:hypothetical protein
MAWAKLGTTTLGSAGDDIDVTVTANKFHSYIYNPISSGSVRQTIRYNSDSGSNYSHRSSFNGATDSTGTSDTSIYGNGYTSRENFGINYAFGISSEEKLVIRLEADREASGAATAPSRLEGVGKWSNTSDDVTKVSLYNTLSGDFDTDSNLTVIGSD